MQGVAEEILEMVDKHLSSGEGADRVFLYDWQTMPDGKPFQCARCHKPIQHTPNNIIAVARFDFVGIRTYPNPPDFTMHPNCLPSVTKDFVQNSPSRFIRFKTEAPIIAKAYSLLFEKRAENTKPMAKPYNKDPLKSRLQEIG